MTKLSELEFIVLFRSLARDEDCLYREDILNAIQQVKEQLKENISEGERSSERDSKSSGGPNQNVKLWGQSQDNEVQESQ